MIKEVEPHTFNVSTLTQAMFGFEKEQLDRWHQVNEVCAKDSVLRNDPNDYGKSRQELFELYAKKTLRFHKLIGYNEKSADICTAVFPEQMPTLMNLKMFVPTIRLIGTEKQVEKWIPLANKFEIIGCYAQTELGHGSDVQSLETTAVYDQGKDEFIINSPTVSSTKWWIGDLGIIATHCVVVAQLTIKDVYHGPQTFIVPIRDTNTFEVLPNIIAGDIGPKYGFNTKDNGFVRFNNVRIPRENMLMRYTKVSKTGVFKKPRNEKVAYATMMQVRTLILAGAFSNLFMGLFIALRYSLTRTQFKDEKGVERKIIDYQTQQDKITPLVADVFAQLFGAQKVNELAVENIRRINENMDFSLLQDLHSTVSSCKAVYTWQTHFGLEKLRQSCGGHGYSHYSRFPSLITESAPACTYEGENTILLLQCARYLLTCLSNARKGKPGNENVDYLQNLEETLTAKLELDHYQQLLCPETIRKILRFNAAFHVSQAGLRMITSISEKGIPQKEAWDKHAGIALVDASTAHNHYWTMRSFLEAVVKMNDEKIRAILSKLSCLFGISRVIEKPNAYVEGGYIKGDQLEIFYNAKEYLLEQLRPHLSTLLDGFPYYENQIQSALTYEKPYDTLLDWAKKNAVNDSNFQKEVFNTYQGIIGQQIQPKL